MEALSLENQDFNKDVLCHIDEVKQSNHRLIIYNNKDFNLVRTLTNVNDRLDLIKELVTNDPRFEWKRIQNEIDSKYRIDPELTGATIHLDWKSAITPRRALLKLTIEKNSNTCNDEIR